MKKKYFLDDCKIKIKLALIFIFCVMLPLIVTNVAMITLIEKSSEKEHINNLNKQMDSVEYSIKTSVETGINVANDIYKDKNVYDFLEYKYTDGLDYYNYYRNLVDDNLKHYYGSFIISKITVYSDNENIVDGGYVTKVSSIKNKEWYKAFSNYDLDKMPVMLYIDYDEKSNVSGGRTISIIKRLNYFNKNKREKIVKVDINYDTLLRDISSNQIVGEVYVCDKDKILLDNKNTHNKNTDFKSIKSIDMKKVGASRKIEDYAKGWTIYIISDEMKFWQRLVGNWRLCATMVLINLLLPTMVILFVGNSFKNRIQLMELKMKKIKEEKFETLEVEPGNDEIGQLIITYNCMVDKIKELIQVVYKEKVEKQELELAKKEAEITALHAQIDPHFLFNILENIRMRSLIKKEDETADIIGELSIMMRKSYDWGKDLISVRDEVEFARAYLKLQKYRFEDKLSFEFKICEECYNIKIPKLTIVTFVENAVVHGIEKVVRNGMIIVSMKKRQNHILLRIADTGRGIKKEKLLQIRDKIYKRSIGTLNNGESIGMMNACNRLFMNFGTELDITIYSRENLGTIIIIKIPTNMLN